MKSTTIRVPTETRDRLNALARGRGTSASELVSKLVNEADDRALLAEAERSWALLAAEPDGLAAYRAEERTLEGFDAELPPY